ncbi:MAG: TIGR04282 family arsenosugar biosynthesis glycosyltransferase [Pseudomonadota bacterium]|nr:TIGR04282 family arsenosugar biosynthesis glycosyltransferase [Pseudomonadota bacterium]
MRQVRVQVFARDPVPGQTKTRLIPALGAAGACDCYRCLLGAMLERVHEAGVGEIELWADQPPTTDELAGLADGVGASLRVQRGKDLGARMAHALEDALADGALPVLVGSDVMGLQSRHVQDAAARLRGGAVAVFAPAEDGGYGLVGLSAPWRALFEDVPWGTSEVLAITRKRTIGRGVAWLDAVWDVDGPADLARLQGDRFSACRP